MERGAAAECVAGRGSAPGQPDHQCNHRAKRDYDRALDWIVLLAAQPGAHSHRNAEARGSGKGAREHRPRRSHFGIVYVEMRSTRSLAAEA